MYFQPSGIDNSMTEAQPPKPPGSLPALDHRDLDQLRPTIEKLMGIAGTAGMVIGVHRDGEKPCYSRFGYQNERKQAVTERTVFPICSLSKLFTSMTVAKWLDSVSSKGNITWNSCIEEVEPMVQFGDKKLRGQVKIVDLLSHNTGMTKSGCYRGSTTSMLIDEGLHMNFISDQVAYKHKDTNFYYNNLGYKLAGNILERRCKKTWSALVQENFLEPWQLHRTFAEHPGPGVDDVSEAYNILDTGGPVKLSSSGSRGTSFAKASGGMYSCVEDLLTAYGHVMNAIKDPAAESSVIKQAGKLFSPHTAIVSGYGDYCLGLVKVNLPGKMGYVGINRELMPNTEPMPTIGDPRSPTQVYYHQGSGAGALAAMAILPEYDTVIVVLSNTLALNDCPDWVLQLVLSKIVGGPSDAEFINYATATRENNLGKCRMLKQKLDNGSGPPPSLELASYRGFYRNEKGYFTIYVDVEDDKLTWTKQGTLGEKFPLYHYQGDCFHWLGERNEMAARGIWIPKEEHYWLVQFHVENGKVNHLTWLHDPHNEKAGEFLKITL